MGWVCRSVELRCSSLELRSCPLDGCILRPSSLGRDRVLSLRDLVLWAAGPVRLVF
jgi:hypothetical protein